MIDAIEAETLFDPSRSKNEIFIEAVKSTMIGHISVFDREIADDILKIVSALKFNY